MRDNPIYLVFFLTNHVPTPVYPSLSWWPLSNNLFGHFVSSTVVALVCCHYIWRLSGNWPHHCSFHTQTGQPLKAHNQVLMHVLSRVGNTICNILISVCHFQVRWCIQPPFCQGFCFCCLARTVPGLTSVFCFRPEYLGFNENSPSTLLFGQFFFSCESLMTSSGT